MIPVLSRAQMRAFDAHAIEHCKVPSIVLMENAGRGAADAIERELLGGRAASRRVVVVCGTGNNGGDGFVVARHLVTRGASVELFLVGEAARLSPDAHVQHESWIGLGGVVAGLRDEGHLGGLREALGRVELAVDALFGTGLERDVTGLAAAVIEAVNGAPLRRVALDVPSGMNADSGAAMGATLRADLTVTFAHLKMGLLTAGAAELTGKLVVADIGVPPSLYRNVGRVADVLEATDVTHRLAPRPMDAHKYSVGHVVVFGGSPGRIGAPLMVAHGALRAGAGLVTIATWPEVTSALESRAVEIMTARLDRQAVTASIDAVLASKRVVAVGPGFGLHDGARAVFGYLLEQWSGPLVVDADALTLLAAEPPAAARAQGSLVLTPHAGEAARLLGSTAAAIEADRLEALHKLVVATRAVVVLKGARTLIGAPDGRVAINPTGNPALATAGAGDVLSGIIAAQCCVLPAFDAACAGVYLHGLAADRWAAAHGDRGLFASEIADELPKALGALVTAHARDGS